MSDPSQTDLPSLNERFKRAHADYTDAKRYAMQSVDEGRDAEGLVWATLAVAAATVLAEPVPHCSACCY